MRRFRITEANQMERIKSHVTGPGIAGIAPADLAWAAGQGWEDDCKGAHSIEALGRHEQRISNQAQKALSRLKDLQREAHELALTEQALPAESGFFRNLRKQRRRLPPKLLPKIPNPTASIRSSSSKYRSPPFKRRPLSSPNRFTNAAAERNADVDTRTARPQSPPNNASAQHGDPNENKPLAVGAK